MSYLDVNSKLTAKKLVDEAIQKTSLAACLKVDQECGDELIVMKNKLSDIFYMLSTLVNDEKAISSDVAFMQLDFFWQAANSLMAALQLSRQGYLTEVVTVNRRAFECVALVARLFCSPEQLPKILSGKIKGQECIGDGKRLFPEFGPINGELSSVAHPGGNMLGTFVRRLPDGSVKLHFGGNLLSDDLFACRHCILQTAFIAVVLECAIDFIFYDNLPSPHASWNKEGSMMKFVPSKDSAIISEFQRRNLDMFKINHAPNMRDYL